MVDGQARSEKLQEEREEKLFHQLNELSKQIGSIGVPPQVLLRQPVTLLDALGQRAPVHLDFIDSAEVTGHGVRRLKFC